MNDFPNISPDELSNIEAQAIKDAKQPFISRQTFLDSFSEKYGKAIGEGRNRLIFSISPDKVLKIAKSRQGIYDNLFEWNIYQNFGSKSLPGMPVFARCYGLQHHHKIPCLVMERVKLIKGTGYSRRLPSWVALIDKSQIGLNKSGVLVAFDYADLNSAAFTFSI